MFYVLIIHANFIAFGAPTVEDLVYRPWDVLGQYLFESLSTCCIDVYVLISGWFGIRYSLMKMCAFLFQVIFFSLGIFLLMLVVAPNQALVVEGIKSIFLFNGSDYWFVKAYLILMVLAPMLNSFCDQMSRHEFKQLLLVYLAIMFIYGCTALSFIGIYLIGRYLSIYRPNFTTYHKKIDGFVYVVVCLLVLLLCFLSLRYGIKTSLGGRLLNHGCPLIIISAISLLLFFCKNKFYNKCVNKVARSCFAVYLLHCNYFIFPYFIERVQWLNKNGGVIAIFIYILIIFVVAISLDCVRIFLWKKCFKHINIFRYAE